MPRVVNCASTWANQTSGSAGQKGGILRVMGEIAAGVGEGARDILGQSNVVVTLSSGSSEPSGSPMWGGIPTKSIFTSTNVLKHKID